MYCHCNNAQTAQTNFLIFRFQKRSNQNKKLDHLHLLVLIPLENFSMVRLNYSDINKSYDLHIIFVFFLRSNWWRRGHLYWWRKKWKPFKSWFKRSWNTNTRRKWLKGTNAKLGVIFLLEPFFIELTKFLKSLLPFRINVFSPKLCIHYHVILVVTHVNHPLTLRFTSNLLKCLFKSHYLWASTY